MKKPQLCFMQEKDLSTGPSINFDLFPRSVIFQPVPLAYQPWAQLSNYGRACTQALLLYIIESPISLYSYKMGGSPLLKQPCSKQGVEWYARPTNRKNQNNGKRNWYFWKLFDNNRFSIGWKINWWFFLM